MSTIINPVNIDPQSIYMNSMNSYKTPQSLHRAEKTDEKKYSYEDLYGIVKATTVIGEDGSSKLLTEILKV